MEEYDSNGNMGLKRMKMDTEYSELNDLVFKWFTDATARMLNVSGPMIQEKAMKFAGELGHTEFKGSNGWLGAFLKRNNIVFKTQSGERGEVKLDTVEQWKAKIATVCQGYEPKDIFNMDESGLFYRDSTKSTFFKKGDTCAGGKRSKQRITVALCASMTGEKLKPLVIGKSRKPRCFGPISADKLPVRYEANRKAWMLTPLMEDWLRTLDRKMRTQKRKILLLLDNAPVHPHIMLSNVKLQFFPANTTSLLQPMDAGIIQTLKLKYRKRQLQHVLVEMEKKPTMLGPQILRDISILNAIYWISSTWKEIKAETIVKCFRKCGFTPETVRDSPLSDVVPLTIESEEDPEEDIPLALLRISMEFFDSDIIDLGTVDDSLATCDTDMTEWERPASEIVARLKDGEKDEDSDAEGDSLALPPVPQAFSVGETCEFIENLKNIALAKDNQVMLDSIMVYEEEFISQRVKSSTIQKKISEFFKVV